MDKCIICGDEFEQNKGKGRRRKICRKPSCGSQVTKNWIKEHYGKKKTVENI